MQLLQLSTLFAASQDHKLWSAGQEEEGEYGDLDALYIYYMYITLYTII